MPMLTAGSPASTRCKVEREVGHHRHWEAAAAADGWCSVGIAFVFLVSPKDDLVYYEGYKIISFCKALLVDISLLALRSKPPGLSHRCGMGKAHVGNYQSR